MPCTLPLQSDCKGEMINYNFVYLPFISKMLWVLTGRRPKSPTFCSKTKDIGEKLRVHCHIISYICYLFLTSTLKNINVYFCLFLMNRSFDILI